MKNKMKDKIKVTFFGTPEFALPSLKALISADFCDVKLVVTQPDKPVGRHHSKLVPSEAKKVAKKSGIRVIHETTPQPPPWQEGEFDLGILVAYGEIIPKKIIDSFPLGILNVHPSLLPKYRGPSPIQAAILNQDKETGVTIIRLDHKMDHGPIVAQEKVRLNGAETAGALLEILAKAGADLLIKIFPDYIAGKISPQAQDGSFASFTKKLTKQDGKIDWSKPADQIEAHIRAMNPWPGAWTVWKGKRLIIWRASVSSRATTPFPLLSKKGIILEEVQLEGSKRMMIDEFLRGRPLTSPFW